MHESQINRPRTRKTVRNVERAKCRDLGAGTGKAIQEPRCSSQLPQLSSYQVNLEKQQPKETEACDDITPQPHSKRFKIKKKYDFLIFMVLRKN
jgi:hypothetical protein